MKKIWICVTVPIALVAGRDIVANAYIIIDEWENFLLVFSHCYLSGRAIGYLADNIDERNKRSAVYALSCYSQVPFFIVLAITKLFPSLIFLIVLGLYSALLFYSGSDSMTRVPGEKRLQFTLLSALIMIVSFIICSELFTLLYTEILDQFSTFAG